MATPRPVTRPYTELVALVPASRQGPIYNAANTAFLERTVARLFASDVSDIRPEPISAIAFLRPHPPRLMAIRPSSVII